MKMYRSKQEVLTENRKPKDYIKDWSPGEKIWFDGTKDKDGKKHTHIAIVLEAPDILALLNKMCRHYQAEIRAWEKTF